MRALRLALLASALLLADCHALRHPVGRLAEPPRDPGLCLTQLAATPGVSFRRLLDTAPAPGCGLTGAVQLLDMQVLLKGVTAMSCPLASATIAWARDGAQPLARAILGSRLVAIETFGTYSCRPINNVPGNNLSEHSTANAVDVSGFRLEDGRRITVLQGWNGPDLQVRLFLRKVHDAACAHYRGVLSPDANALHANHLHLDMGQYRFCR